MEQTGILQFFGGLAMFIFGMYLMRSGAEQAAGKALQRALQTAAGSYWRGFLTGLLVTSVIQSSTATVILCVGLVGAGAMGFRQSAGIVLGANVGTAATAQLIRLMDLGGGSPILRVLQPQTLAPAALIAGVTVLMLARSRRLSAVGTVSGGLGLLFYGLITMRRCVVPLLTAPGAASLLERALLTPGLGFLTGFAGAAAVQSSSAAVGILQMLCASGSLRMTAAQVFPLLLGINLGAAMTAMLLGSLGACGEAKKTAVVFFLLNTAGALVNLATAAALWVSGACPWLGSRFLNAGGIADLHGCLRLSAALALLPLLEPMCVLTERLHGLRQKPAADRQAV